MSPEAMATLRQDLRMRRRLKKLMLKYSYRALGKKYHRSGQAVNYYAHRWGLADDELGEE